MNRWAKDGVITVGRTGWHITLEFNLDVLEMKKICGDSAFDAYICMVESKGTYDA